MDDNLLAMQQAAQKRVQRMQERSRQLCGGPTFGESAVLPAKKTKDTPKTDERMLLLLLILMLSQNGGSKLLLLLLGYLAL